MNADSGMTTNPALHQLQEIVDSMQRKGVSEKRFTQSRRLQSAERQTLRGQSMKSNLLEFLTFDNLTPASKNPSLNKMLAAVLFLNKEDSPRIQKDSKSWIIGINVWFLVLAFLTPTINETF